MANCILAIVLIVSISHTFSVSFRVLVCMHKQTIIWKDASIQLIIAIYACGCRQHAVFYKSNPLACSSLWKEGSCVGDLLAICGLC